MKTLFIIVLGLLIVATAIVVVKSALFHSNNRQLAAPLLTKTDAPLGPYRQVNDLESLPNPVRRYLETVLPKNMPVIQSVRLEQTGTFFLNNTWQPFQATQIDSLDPPGFMWEARIKAGPLLHAHVVDYYVQGEGGLQAKLLGALSLMNVKGTEEINSGELMRWLAETPWYPTALLPSAALLWSSRDDHSATATLTDSDLTVSLTFYFNDNNEITTIEGLRYRGTNADASLTPWRGRFWDYAEHDGIRIPLSGEVAWLLPEGETPYWRGSIETIRFATVDVTARGVVDDTSPSLRY